MVLSEIEIKKRNNICTHNNYLKNKDKYYNRVKQSRQKRRQWLTEYKKTLCCKICGETESCCLDFHHKVPSQKVIGIARMLRRGFPISKIEEEIKKCEVLCANCHRKEHLK